MAAAIHIYRIGEDFSLILKGYLSLVSTRNRLDWKIPYSKGKIVSKAVNREGKRSRRYRDRHFAKFERSRRYRDR